MKAMSTGIAGLFAGGAQGFGVSVKQVEAAQEATTQAEAQSQGGAGSTADFVVDLSETAKRLSRQENPFAKALGAVSGAGAADSDEEDDSSSVTRQIRELKKRIETLRKEIDEIRQGEGSEEEKRTKAAVKEAELATLQAQLMELMKQQTAQTMPGNSSGGDNFYNTGSLT